MAAREKMATRRRKVPVLRISGQRSDSGDGDFTEASLAYMYNRSSQEYGPFSFTHELMTSQQCVHKAHGRVDECLCSKKCVSCSQSINTNKMDEIMKDKRFAHISKDPRFRTMPQKQRKVKIDKRFKSMFSDKRFKMKYTVDKRGRPVNHTTNENLKKFYDLSDTGSDSESVSDDGFHNDSSDEESALLAKLGEKIGKQPKPTTSRPISQKKNITEGNSDVCEQSKTTKKQDHKNMQVKESEGEAMSSKKIGDVKFKNEEADSEDSHTDENESDDEEDTSDDIDSELEVGDGEPDYARGEGMIESSTDEDDDEEDDVDDSLDHNWGELDKNVPDAKEIGKRLAVCNMDWDRIKAKDIFVLLNSFKPAGGMIVSVRIYPSEFGMERMKEEAMQGPTELKELTKEVNVDEEEDENEDEEENVYHREKLRQYQLNRLKYYYAVAEFDSKKTANAVYDDCDGMEYQTSAAKIDLRFIPDDMMFDQSVKSECVSMPDTSVYKPPKFLTTALCQTKVNLTWDETDQDRVKVTMRKFDKKSDVDEDDFKAYLASSSENEDPDYDKLIVQSDGSSESPDEDEQIEKYRSLLKDIDASEKKDEMNMEIEWEPGLKDATKDILKNKEKSKEMTPWKQYQEQKKEKKKQKREERKQKRLADKAAGPIQTFSDDELPADLDLNDSFFTDEVKSKPKSSKKKKGKKKNKEEEKDEETEKEKAELSLLLMDEEEDGRQHFSLGDLVEKDKKKKKKDKKEDVQVQDDFHMDLKDSRFDAVFSSHLFNIDPSAPEFKKTKGMETLMQEKLKRRTKESQSGIKKKSKLDEMEKHDTQTMDLPKEESLSSLLKSVKTKTQQFHSKKVKKKKS